MPKVKASKLSVVDSHPLARKSASKKQSKPSKGNSQVTFKADVKGKGKQQAQAPEAAGSTTALPKSTTSNTPPAIPTTSTFLVVVGSYEKNLYGIEGTFSAGSTSAPKLRPIFIFPAHLSCIKAVAASPGGGKWLATGSDDEFVKIWDLKRRKEVGGLSQHVGSITSVTFPTRSHLLSASEDSTISLFRTNDWALLRSLKGHSGRINCIDVHPSGKVALSVGKDKTLKMWDLMRGRGAASLPLGVEAEIVRFSASGAHFAVLSPQGVDIYALDMKRINTIAFPKRLLDVRFASAQDDSGKEHEMLLVATEDGKVLCYDVSEAVAAGGDDDDEREAVAKAVFGGHSNRVKAISVLRLRLPDDDAKVVKTLFSTVSSDGKINVHDLSHAFTSASSDVAVSAADAIQPIASYDTKGSRLVCCTMAESSAGHRVVRESAGGDYEVDEDEEGAEGDDDVYGDYEEGEEEQEVEVDEEEAEETEE